MTTPPPDLDSSRRAVAARDLVGQASDHLTTEIAMHLPFESLVAFKKLLKRFFSAAPWTDRDAAALSDLVTQHVTSGWWRHELAPDIEMTHGVTQGSYVLYVSGGQAETSIFDRAFSGPVVPEATPHPRKVKFSIGGDPSPGIWFRRDDPDAPTDERVAVVFSESDVTDVMVAGDFVTVGLAATSSWETRLEDILSIVAEQFHEDGSVTPPERTREELLHEAGQLAVSHRPEELHLLDPDDPGDAATLTAALADDDPRVRRIAVALLIESSDRNVALATAVAGFADPSRTVRRTAIDATADVADPQARTFFERALSSEDAWIRWKAVRALGELGLATSRSLVMGLAEDDDFQVRLEVATVLRD